MTKVYVFPIESQSLAGYLVIGVFEEFNEIEEHFLKNCGTSLREEMANNKISARLEDGFWIYVPEVDFLNWSRRRPHLQWLFVMRLQRFGAAFFAVARPIPKFNLRGPKTWSLCLRDIATDQPVNFNAYLHLKKNQKFYLYLRDGRHLQPNQKETPKGQ